MSLALTLAAALLGGTLAAIVLLYLLAAVLYGQRDLLGRRVGGLFHWRIGRIGGSLYITKRRAA